MILSGGSLPPEAFRKQVRNSFPLFLVAIFENNRETGVIEVAGIDLHQG